MAKNRPRATNKFDVKIKRIDAIKEVVLKFLGIFDKGTSFQLFTLVIFALLIGIPFYQMDSSDAADTVQFSLSTLLDRIFNDSVTIAFSFYVLLTIVGLIWNEAVHRKEVSRLSEYKKHYTHFKKATFELMKEKMKSDEDVKFEELEDLDSKYTRDIPYKPSNYKLEGSNDE
ncbi:MAG: hypothetical protein COA73_10150 [Candidatus Hydrogenedentota bacterium]|nr:MAG: hypothetical protein COA73_10150 [Candidatus Hydrogenedentota bacterium]